MREKFQFSLTNFQFEQINFWIDRFAPSHPNLDDPQAELWFCLNIRIIEKKRNSVYSGVLTPAFFATRIRMIHKLNYDSVSGVSKVLTKMFSLTFELLRRKRTASKSQQIKTDCVFCLCNCNPDSISPPSCHFLLSSGFRMKKTNTTT